MKERITIEVFTKLTKLFKDYMLVRMQEVFNVDLFNPKPVISFKEYLEREKELEWALRYIEFNEDGSPKEIESNSGGNE